MSFQKLLWLNIIFSTRTLISDIKMTHAFGPERLIKQNFQQHNYKHNLLHKQIIKSSSIPIF